MTGTWYPEDRAHAGLFKPGHCQVCLICPARHSKGNKYYFPRVRSSKRPSMDLVCSQQDPRPVHGGKMELGGKARRE